MGVLVPSYIKGYFRIHKIALRFNGISLDGYRTLTYRVYSAIVISSLIVMYPIMSFFELFKHEADNFNDIFMYTTAGFSVLFCHCSISIQCCLLLGSLTVSVIAAITKALVMITNRHKFGDVLRKLENKPFRPDPNRGGEAEERLINECVLVTNAQTYVYWSMGATNIIVTVLISLIKTIIDSDYRQFPYGAFAPIDITSKLNYEICWLYQVCGFLMFASAYASSDLLICAALVHMSYQFKVLQNFVKQMVEISYKDMIKDNGSDAKEIDASVIPYGYLHKTLKTAVEYHVAILDLCAELETSFSSLILGVFLISLILLGIAIYHTAMAANDARLIRYLGEIGSGILQVALFCYWGQQVIEESKKVGYAAYESNFVGTDLRFQRDISLIIRRSQTPTAITAGKFSDVGMPSFTWILRSSYSAFMVLRRGNSK